MKTIAALLDSLRAAGLTADVLEAPGGGRAVVVAELGAKVMGAGIDEENLFWAAEGIAPGQWCVGGQRTWLAPELGSRGFFGAGEEHWAVAPQLDPGGYREIPARLSAVSGAEGRRVYRSEMTLVRPDGLRVDLALQREISLRSGPSGLGIPALELQVRHVLINRGEHPLDREVGLWSILQIPSERNGTLILRRRTRSRAGAGTRAVEPESAAAVSEAGGGQNGQPRLYFGELPADSLRGDGDLLLLRVRAGQRWKVGFPAASVHGLTALVRPSRLASSWTLVVQQCALMPAGIYLDGPPGRSKCNGDALQCYNHGDPALPFSEMECHAPARVLLPGGRQAATVRILLAKGELERIVAAAKSVLGRPPDLRLLYP